MSNLCDKLAGALSGRKLTIENEADYLNSAVLVPLIKRDGGLSVLFEVRSAKLKRQPGEICFPGGRIEAGDPNPLAAAVRETAEELGIDANFIKPLGPLDYVVAPIGVLLHPFAGYIDEKAVLKPNKDEVAEIFTVPLEYLLDVQPQVAHMELATRPREDFPAHLLPEYQMEWKKRYTYSLLFYQYEKYVIWGLTARVLASFLKVVKNIK